MYVRTQYYTYAGGGKKCLNDDGPCPIHVTTM